MGQPKSEANAALETIRQVLKEWAKDEATLYRSLCKFALEANSVLPGPFLVDYSSGWRGLERSKTPTSVSVHLYRNDQGTTYDEYKLRPGHRPICCRFSLKNCDGGQEWRCIKVSGCTANEFVGAAVKRLDQCLKMQAEPSQVMRAIAMRICKPIIYLRRTISDKKWSAWLAIDSSKHCVHIDEEIAIDHLLHSIEGTSGIPWTREGYTVILLSPVDLNNLG